MQRGVNSTMSARYQTVITKLRDIDAWGVLFGLLGLFLWVWVSSYSIVTTKALMLGGDGAGVMVTWTTAYDMFMELIHGGYGFKESIATAFAIVVFLLYVISTSGHEGFSEHLASKGKGLNGLFMTGMIILLVLDWYANFQYLNAFPATYQWLISIGITFVIMFIGRWAIHTLMASLFEEE